MQNHYRCDSESPVMMSGIPQGSVLDLILFINNLVDCVKYCTVRLFADDALIYLPINNSSQTAVFRKTNYCPLQVEHC